MAVTSFCWARGSRERRSVSRASAGINIYGYVGEDPLNFTDPLGLCLGYGDRYLNHLSRYAIQLPDWAVAAFIGGGVIPKTWAPIYNFRPAPFGSPNPFTSVARGFTGWEWTGTAVARGGFAGAAVVGAAIGGYNVGVVLSGLIYAAGGCN